MHTQVKKSAHIRLLSLFLLVATALLSTSACLYADPGEDTQEQGSALITTLPPGPCLGPPSTSGSVGYQSRTRYISRLVPDATYAYALRATWAINGVNQSSGLISFGTDSGVSVRIGQDCGLPGPDQGDCAIAGFISPCFSGACTGPNDRIWKIFFTNTSDVTVSTYIPITRVFINGSTSPSFELWGMASTAGASEWTWGTTGLTKIYADSTDTRKFWWDGYDSNNSLLEKSNKWSNNSCLGR